MNHIMKRCLDCYPVFCTNFGLILFNFSPKAIDKGAHNVRKLSKMGIKIISKFCSGIALYFVLIL